MDFRMGQTHNFAQVKLVKTPHDRHAYIQERGTYQFPSTSKQPPNESSLHETQRNPSMDQVMLARTPEQLRHKGPRSSVTVANTVYI